MGIFLGRKSKRQKGGPSQGSIPEEEKPNPVDLQKYDLYNKGINSMSNEKFDDAIRSFELALRLDQKYVDAWIKKGYAHFHLGEYKSAISAYDRALEIDINNVEPWNLKGLAYYRLKNYDKAIAACEKAIDVNPNDAMVWYNYACYLVLSGRIDEGLEGLKRSIEIDINYAKKSVRDRDFESARAEEGFRRIIEVVVLESIRQGYNYVGKIVWVTGMDRQDVEDAVMRLTMKGLLIRKEKKTITSKEEYYEIAQEIADKIGYAKHTGFLRRSKVISAPLQELKDISEIIGMARISVEKGDTQLTLDALEKLINPAQHGGAMIEQFFDEHRDVRLYHIRIKDRGQEYLNSHKTDLINLLSEIDAKVRGNIVSSSASE
ncbi:MAG TPA: tetratricopeptide repeat protein [Nitrososphaeraceae archaeon]|jgi:tetratricopeptide (TPR) repeat protein|nr:tetratricopeptide repeat protein [Nitrososphaeraceae archaeon]